MLVILFFIVLIFLYIFYPSYYIIHMTTKMYIDDAYNLAETGDIVYFRWNTVAFEHELISPFTHIGIVIVKSDGNKYILETHLSGDTNDIGIYKGGINIYPLKLRLTSYQGHKFISKLSNFARPSHKDIQDFIMKIDDYKNNIPFHDDYKGYFINNCLKNRIFNSELQNKKGMFCSEFIGYCLTQLNITSKDFNFKCLVPGDFRFIKYDNKLLYDKDNLIKIN